MVFEFERPNNLPPEITPELVADLHDCVFKFGIDDFDRRGRRVWLSEPTEIAVSVSPDVTIFTTFVFGAGGHMSEGAYSACFTAGGILMWDKRVTANDIKLFIAKIDAIFLERGWIDHTNGARVRREALVQTEPTRPSADRIFKDPGVPLLVPPGKNAQAMRLEFEDPEQVAVVTTPFGQVLCHARDRVQVKRRQELAMQALRELGYDDPSTLPQDIEGVLALRKKIQERIIEMESE